MADEAPDRNGEELSDREVMALIEANIAAPVSGAAAARILSDESVGDRAADEAGQGND